MSGNAATLKAAASRVIWIAIALTVVGFSLMVAAVAAPIGAQGDDESVSARRLRPMPQGSSDLQPLLVRLAARELVRPASLQAAVKDDGTAQRLLKSLKLQGVINLDGQLVAYVQVEKEGVQTVRRGDRVLEFVVERVEPAAVTLSLQGVEVTLGH